MDKSPVIRIWITNKNNSEITNEINDLWDNLRITNLKLWEVEDQKRLCEKNKTFDKNFIELARNVYRLNDERAKIKLKINEILGSNIKEVKSHF